MGFDLSLSARVARGHRAASGNEDYPEGTLALQAPHFRAGGVDLSAYRHGTINLDLVPAALRPVNPQITLRDVRWTDRIPAETFSFTSAEIEFQGKAYRALLYYPHPELKVENFQPPTVLEFLCESISGLAYGDEVVLRLESARFADFYATDPYRPVFHLAPRKGWMNDPNGLVHDGTLWHAFYQAYDPQVVDGLTWGHATSPDLVQWEEQPVALLPDENGQCWSGSAVRTEEGLACLFTYWNPREDGRQCQGLATSRNGTEFLMHPGNPVIPQLRHQPGQPDHADFRDPKVFWHEETERWIMVVAGGELRFYGSTNVVEWELLGHQPEIVTECPDLFRLDSPRGPVWVLSGGGDWMQVGEFDGFRFTPTQARQRFTWGPDGYATQTFSDAPDGRRIALTWLYSWKYGVEMKPSGVRHPFPTSWSGGCQSTPVELSLREVDGQLRVCQVPVREIGLARGRECSNPSGLAAWDAEFSVDPGAPWQIEFAPGTDRSLVLKSDGEGIRLHRRGGGLAHVPHYEWEGGVELPRGDGVCDLRILRDRCSLEVFTRCGADAALCFALTEPGKFEVEVSGELTGRYWEITGG